MNFKAIVDTREKKPLVLTNKSGEPLETVRKTLPTGDYSIVGLESEVAIERKSLEDLLGCIGRDRARFEREIQRLLAYPVRAIVVEGTWRDIELGQYRSLVKPQAALGSMLGWIGRGVPILMLDTHERAGKYVSNLLRVTAKRKLDQMKDFLKAV